MIKIHLVRVLLDRQISSKELTDKIGIIPANLSILKTGKAKGIRFDMLNKLCEVLKCQPGDLMSFDNDAS
ncbi:helix-turn-helix transcriptional regulator [Weissella minor]|uniref:helix-turn-helix domain-containing protein n=1 Tax=Weissella minor TaxID=1620 RepID=UPI001BAFED43|nr:helix-turn-helix transcriptional regulator [Weissella minor]MBS0949447.1 helix-turn-helix transcriptional regulator [Weissella minor]